MSHRRVLLLLPVLLVAAFPATAAAADCQRQVGEAPNAGQALTDPVALVPEEGSEQRLRNFGDSRGVKAISDVRLVSDKRLPDTLTSAQIGFGALIERAGDTLESVDFTAPTFTEPTITRDRKHIQFTICLSAAGLNAGNYVGNVTVTGPEGLGEARVGITANLKAGLIIWFAGAALAILIAGAALYFKDRTTDPSKITPGWWFKTVAVLAVAFAALAGVYFTDPAWGANVGQAILALIGSALASVGGRKLIE